MVIILRGVKLKHKTLLLNSVRSFCMIIPSDAAQESSLWKD